MLVPVIRTLTTDYVRELASTGNIALKYVLIELAYH